MTPATMLNKFLCLLWGCSEELYFGKEFIVEYPSGNKPENEMRFESRYSFCSERCLMRFVGL